LPLERFLPQAKGARGGARGGSNIFITEIYLFNRKSSTNIFLNAMAYVIM